MRILIYTFILTCALALSATIAAIIYGTRSFEGLVVDKPYESGLAWDRDRRICDRLAWKMFLQPVEVHTGRNEVTIRFFDRFGVPLSNATVTVIVSRPSTRAYDRRCEVSRRTNSAFAAFLDLPLPGAWDVSVEAASGDGRCVFKNRISAVTPSADTRLNKD